VSERQHSVRFSMSSNKNVHTNRMTARELWFLSVLCLKNIADAVEQFDIALLRICLNC
jgi:hypothetical protein